MRQPHDGPAENARVSLGDDGSCPAENAAARPDLAARLGADDAARIIAGQYIAGIDLGQIRAHHEDVAACLLADARTASGRAYAREYAATASYLITHLRQDHAVASGRSAAACAQPDGTPHPDPLLAGRGWHADRGLWQRSGTRGPGPDGGRP